MYIQALCPTCAQPENIYIKGALNFSLDIAVVVGLHVLAAYILGMNPLLGLAFGGFASIAHRFIQCGTAGGGACAGALPGTLIGALVGVFQGEFREGAGKGAFMGALILSSLAFLGTIFLTYYIGVQMWNSIPSLAVKGLISYPQALTIMGVAMGLECMVGLTNTTLILCRANKHDRKYDVETAVTKDHPVYGTALYLVGAGGRMCINAD